MLTNENEISRAAELLKNGALVAFPTETVYGLGANALDERAVAEIFARKGRPQFNPLIVHVPDVAAAKNHVQWNAQAEALAKKFWPGPLTLVLPRSPDCKVSLLCSAGLDTLAIRVPAHPIAQQLLRAAGIPIAAPSANRSGRVSPTTAAHVREEFGNELCILDGGACEVGLESTVIDLTGNGPIILRPGAITCEMLGIGAATGNQQPATIHSPGMLEKHYAPTLPVRLNATDSNPGEALLAFGPTHVSHSLNLSESSDLKEAAANLFAMLRALDNPQFSAIAVMPVPEQGLGVAINDRLKRAAAR